MPQMTEKRCEDHRMPYLGACPFCRAGLEPVRFQEARADFAGLPLAGTLDVLPHYDVVALEDVLRVLGGQLLKLERLEEEAIRPFAQAKSLIYGHMRKAKIQPRMMQQAVRIHMGKLGSEHAAGSPAIQALLEILRSGDGRG